MRRMVGGPAVGVGVLVASQEGMVVPLVNVVVVLARVDLDAEAALGASVGVGCGVGVEAQGATGPAYLTTRDVVDLHVTEWGFPVGFGRHVPIQQEEGQGEHQ